MGIGAYSRRVVFQGLSSAPDGEGGRVETWTDLDPPWDVAINPTTVRKTVRDQEHLAGGTVVATALHLVTGRYRPDVGIDARMIYAGRTFRILGATNVDERGVTMELYAVEMV